MLVLAAGFAGHIAPLRAQTPSASLRRVGVLVPSTRAREEVILKPFFAQMSELGWVEGQNIAYDRSYGDDQQRDLPRLAAELVARRPELIYAPAYTGAIAARQATRTIPIVFAAGSDPVGAGLVASLAHPGGNATGLTSIVDSLAPKRVEILREILPRVRRVGLLGDPTSLMYDRTALAPVAVTLGLTIIVAEASDPHEFDEAVAKLIGQGVEAIIANSTLALNLRARLIELANSNNVPVVGVRTTMVEAGALFAYSSSLDGLLRRSAQMVDKVLKGANPAEMAVEQPTRFELAVNLKTAKTLGITVPRSIMLRADRVIE